jgi:hypothetical protein
VINCYNYLGQKIHVQFICSELYDCMKNETGDPASCNIDRALLNVSIKCKLCSRTCDVPDGRSDDVCSCHCSTHSTYQLTVDKF